MDLDPESVDPRRLYGFLTALVLPRPIGWISTVDPDGRRNLAPFSFFNGIAAAPLAVSVAILHAPAGDRRKDTWRNIEATREFVVNLVDDELVAAMNVTSAEFEAEVDEFTVAGLEAAASATVRPPRVAAAPAQLECRLFDSLRVGDGLGGATLVVGEVTHIHVADRVVEADLKVDLAQLRPVARLGGSSYGRLGEVFDLPRQHYRPDAGAAAPARDGATAPRPAGERS